MAASIYDDDGFFAAYARLPRSQHGLDGAPEWPALRDLLPPLDGRRVLDLGCGYGWFCRWAREVGASSVVGVDGSTRMLERAGAMTDDGAIEYVLADLDEIDLEALDGPFDVAFSSLTLHYVNDLDRLLGHVRGVLADGGALVCSVEHPIFTAPRRPGFIATTDGGRGWPVDAYSIEGERTVEWLGSTVRKQHRTIGTWLRSLRQAGFELTDLVEWAPTDRQVADQPALADERERPMFLLLSARAGGSA